MKRIYMILCAALVTGGAFGQIAKPKAQLEKSVDRVTVTTEIPQNVDRDIIWENTFSDPNEWSTGNDGPVDINFQVGTGLETTGQAPINTINSATYDDGCAMVDSDGYANQSGIENCWVQTVNPINLAANPYVQIEFSNQYYMWDGGASDGNEYCLLELSLDGTTWPDVSTTTVESADPGTRFELWPDMATQDFVANPTNVKFDISQYAGGQETVYLRFRWVGTYGYAWFIDDISVYDGYATDLSIEGEAFADYSAYTNLNGTKFVAVEGEGDDLLVGLEYFKYPESQRPNIMAYTPVINWGANDITDAVLTGTFNGESISSEAQAIAAGAAIDSISVVSFPTDGLAPGVYDMELEISSALTVDEFTDNNMAVAPIEMTEFIMARDDNQIRGGFPGTNILGDGFSGGPLFEIFGDGIVYAIDFALTTNTVPGEECLVQLLDANTENFDALGNSESVQIWEGNYNDFSGGDVTWVTVTLENPVSVASGDLLLPVVTYFGGAGLQIGEAQTDAPDQTAFVFGDLGTAGVDWYFSNDVPMVRLNFNPGAVDSVEDLDEASAFGLGQNMPNPATGVTTINYELFQNGKVTFEVFDITGKVVYSSNEGQRGAGAYALQFDTESFNAGIYTYTLTVNGERLTKKMMVK